MFGFLKKYKDGDVVIAPIVGEGGEKLWSLQEYKKRHRAWFTLAVCDDLAKAQEALEHLDWNYEVYIL